LEFAGDSVWVLGQGRRPGSQIYDPVPATGGSRECVFRFGTKSNAGAGILTISVFFRDSNDTILDCRDCVIPFEKESAPVGQLGEIVETLKWLHQRLRIAMYLVVIGASLVGGLWSYLKFAGMNPEERQDLLIKLTIARSRYKGMWREDFLINPVTQQWLTAGDWNQPTHGWKVTHNVLTTNSDDGRCEIAGSAWGMPNPELFNNEDLYDFTLRLLFAFPKKGSVSWVVRAQRDAKRGYIFTLRQNGNTLHMDGVASWQGSRSALIPVHGFDVRDVDCCADDDTVDLTMRITDYDFILSRFVLQNLHPGQRKRVNKPIADETYSFRDGYRGFRHGSLALFAIPNQGTPKFDYVLVSNAK
jgi:hypothetical protein